MAVINVSGLTNYYGKTLGSEDDIPDVKLIAIDLRFCLQATD